MGLPPPTGTGGAAGASGAESVRNAATAPSAVSLTAYSSPPETVRYEGSGSSSVASRSVSDPSFGSSAAVTMPRPPAAVNDPMYARPV